MFNFVHSASFLSKRKAKKFLKVKFLELLWKQNWLMLAVESPVVALEAATEGVL